MENDRQLQKKALTYLKGIYPSRCDVKTLAVEMDAVPIHLLRNLTYLREHDLVTGSFSVNRDALAPSMVGITAKGIDFIEEDGGLSAILGVVTVRLHADTVRDLLLAQIEEADAESSVKEQLKATVNNLPAKGLEALVTRLASEGITRLPNAVQWLQTFISGAV
ncbi:MAG TPA: hypothetical protein DEP32_05570 [Pseudomonas sp.]|mgnify:CR=1 FL=1|uniref:Transcriptional regulator n=1 Tax=Pseudomonas abyssi TaxID=170540 RepID=A0A395R7B6_9PSED|nr:hypothetical protein [Halopseudomonas gallaeciensis]MAQ50044.1 hypothetical protein [Pseudomonas sp.]MBB51966.1 hypothetical protein [Pseudomonadales bacterium]RGP55986.1 hypothetical protein ASB58_00955 [Halopseudomonas gallaeciensis]HCA23620.1 hypothetical protein [Pseudomonas sp.]|tara:strand:+ start:11030 stop:11521 length:492 start_codon:yes stop_codon:yes gene_type:complete